MRTKTFFKLKLKRSGKLYPQIMLVTIFLVVGLVLSCVLLINKNNSSESKQKLRIGVVGDSTDSYLGIGVDILTQIDISRFSIDFVNLDEDSAIEDLKAGKLSGYLKVPDDFIDSITRGKNTPLLYVTSKSPTGFGTLMVEEIGQIVSGFITRAQDAIEGMEEIADEYEIDDEIDVDEKIAELNIEYIETVLGRSDVYNVEYLGVAENLSLGGYLICGILMLFLLLWGITCNGLLSKKDRSFDVLLHSKGQSVFSQVTSEILSYFLVTIITFLIFSVIVGVLFQFVNVGIEELENANAFDYIGFVLKIIPVLMMISVMHVFVYDLITGEVGVVLFQLIFAIGTGYISGCLYPSYFFPISVQKVAQYLPSGVGVSYLRQTMSKTLSLNGVLLVLAYTALFMILAVLMRRYRLAGRNK